MVWRADEALLEDLLAFRVLVESQHVSYHVITETCVWAIALSGDEEPFLCIFPLTTAR